MATSILSMGESLVDVEDKLEVPPIVNPAVPPPPVETVSAGAAAREASGAASAPHKFLGIDFEDNSVKNLIFVGLVVYIALKYGRGLIRGN